ncbi:transcriptional regulator [Streptomyces sp. NPDC052101]|uniref:ArsR family transcriptional regulator n=1 Tax=Streptomyces sp. NPDC052101 TaxID=3155763 RepID=UPI003449DBE5
MTAPGTGHQDPSAEVLTEAAVAFGLESDVTGLAERVGGALPAVSQHLTKLKLAGLVHSRREGRRQVYFADAAGQTAVVDVVRLLVGRLAEREAAAAVPARRLRGL